MYTFVCCGAILGMSSLRYMFIDDNNKYFLSMYGPSIDYVNEYLKKDVEPYIVEELREKKHIKNDQIIKIFEQIENNKKFITF